MQFLTDKDLCSRYGARMASYDLMTGDVVLMTTDGREWHKQSDGLWYEQHEAESFVKFSMEMMDFIKENYEGVPIKYQEPYSINNIKRGGIAQWQRSLMQT